MNRYNKFSMTLLIVAILLVGTTSVFSVPPHPELLEKIVSGQKAVPSYMNNINRYKSDGICAPSTMNILSTEYSKTNQSTNRALATNFNVLAILVNFNDKASFTEDDYYDTLLFHDPVSSVKKYYSEISYGQLDLVTIDYPSATGWNTAPEAYSYYCNGENGMGGSSYPNNSQRLVEDVIAMVDGSVDFSDYDNNGDGYVDAVIVIHSGQGAEVTGSDDDLWSHKWNTKTPRMTSDGVYVYEYTIQPEYLNNPGDMTIGIICHELGHAFGLPDLYDIDNSSYGIGMWGIMSYGSWAGGNGSSPAHPSGWSRIKMGFTQPIDITSNVNSQAITDVKSSGDVYRLWSGETQGSEYFLIENRQKTGFDSGLPGSGLLIWHIDEDKASSSNNDNTDEWYPGLDASNHFRVALEQADGLFEIEHANDLGDVNDPFVNGTSFNTLSPVTSDTYTDGASYVSVDNISTSGETMYADITVGLAASLVNTEDDEPLLPTELELAQNYPNPFNPTTTIDFYSSSGGLATLEVYNVNGQKVKTVLYSDIMAGQNTTEWDGTNSEEEEVSSGLYFYQLMINNVSIVKKMLLIR